MPLSQPEESEEKVKVHSTSSSKKKSQIDSPPDEKMSSPASSTSKLDMRTVSLTVLTLQNALLGICMRKARTNTGPMFINSTAVLMGEVVKFFVCLFLVFRDENSSVPRWFASLRHTFVDNFRDTIVVCVPSAVYFLQNVLLYVAASNLDVATYQITYQMKILTTAVFAMAILGRTFSKQRWLALFILVAGVATVQLSGVKETMVSSEVR